MTLLIGPWSRKAKTVSKSEFAARPLDDRRDVEASGQALMITDGGEPRLEPRPLRPLVRDPWAALRGAVLRDARPCDTVCLEGGEMLD